MERFHLLCFLPLSLVRLVSRCFFFFFKQVFFHSKHVVALGESHPAESGVRVREAGGRDSVWGWGVADPENLQTARTSLEKYLK